jgi:hypothetical protein
LELSPPAKSRGHKIVIIVIFGENSFLENPC